jgi:hypothetical protein
VSVALPGILALAKRAPGVISSNMDAAREATANGLDFVAKNPTPRALIRTTARKAAAAIRPTPPPAPPQVPTVSPMAAGMSGAASLDDILGGAPASPPVTSAPSVAATPADALAQELAARSALQAPINWRTTDITPIKRPGSSIYFGEESTPGLLKLLQDAQLAKNQPLADTVLKAIRQRSHITGKVGGP